MVVVERGEPKGEDEDGRSIPPLALALARLPGKPLAGTPPMLADACSFLLPGLWLLLPKLRTDEAAEEDADAEDATEWVVVKRSWRGEKNADVTPIGRPA